MADDSRAVRILSDLCGVLRREKNICEFGFVYCPEPLYNKSPIVVVDGNLGIETWSIKLLYFHAYSQLFHNKQRQCDLKRTSDCSMAVVLLNAECLSAWNLRKQLVLNKYLRAEEELNLARLVLSKHPKSPETFSQRRWLLQQLFPPVRPRQDTSSENPCQDGDQNVPNPNPAAERLQDDMGRDPDDENAVRRLHEEKERLMPFVRAEMDVCTLAAGRYPSNYNAWSHRMWVVEHLAGNPPQFLKSELAATKSWVSVHVSDHSGFHYRQFLLGTLMGVTHLTHPRPGHRQRGRLVSDAGLPGGLVLEELQLILELVTSYPGHEAVWYHRRFVVYLWKTLLCNGTSTGSEQIIKNQDTTSSLQPPSLDDRLVENRPVGNLSVGKRPSENQQIGNQPLGKRPSENQPVGNQVLEELPSKNWPIEKGHGEGVALRAEIDMGSGASAPSANGEDSQTGQAGEVEDALKSGSPLSPMQLPSRCSHDASLLHLTDQQVSSWQPPPQTLPWGRVTSQASPRVASCVDDDAFLAGEILRLVQHEKRFVDIVVEGTPSREKAAQQKCAENYCRWLENLQAVIR